MRIRTAARTARHRYELEILPFLQEHGAALSIDAISPCTEEQNGWDAMISEIRG